MSRRTSLFKGGPIEFHPSITSVADDYDDVADRATDLRPSWEETFGTLEQAHRVFFDHVAPRYHRTGAVRASLTRRNAKGAIRRMHKGTAQFGTRINYAFGLTKAPSDPESGQVRKAPPGKGKYAVFVASGRTKRRIDEGTLDYIVGDFGEAGR